MLFINVGYYVGDVLMFGFEFIGLDEVILVDMYIIG